MNVSDQQKRTTLYAITQLGDIYHQHI